MSKLLECKNITKQKGYFTLSDIHFDLEPGYIMGIIGRNGAGKTTLIRTLLGSYKLTNPYDESYGKSAEIVHMKNSRGDVLLSGISLNKHPEKYKENIAYVMNETPFDMSLNPEDNGRIYGSYYKKFHQETYREYLKQFDVPAIALKKLSKGQQIKQQLAFALSYDAKLFIFDEPAGNLDIEFREEFYCRMRKLTEDGSRSIIYVSHLVEEMEQFADYLLWIQEETDTSGDKWGRQKFFGTLEELREEYQIVESDKNLELLPEEWIVGERKREMHTEILVHTGRNNLPEQLRRVSRPAAIREIMYYTEGEVK